MFNRLGTPIAVAVFALALFIPVVSATEHITWAEVDGYHQSGSAFNKVDYWCGPDGGEKLNPGGRTYLLTSDYALVVVKAGSNRSTNSPNTLFYDVVAGETVWADSNGDGEFNRGDKAISHIIVCYADESEPTPTPTPEGTPTPTPSEGPECGLPEGCEPTPRPTLPATDTASAEPVDAGWGMFVIVMVFAASALTAGTLLQRRRR